jgi:UDP-GlcNAc:undecaprenyl-phosphate GlcNAc-1-phosphate transferase
VGATLAVALLARVAARWNLVDRPGGRKAHARAVPLIGGLAIFATLTATAIPAGLGAFYSWYFVGAALLVAVGAWDDRANLRPRWRFAAQVLAAALMVFASGVELHVLGDLAGTDRPIGLWVLSAPLTIFAVVGVVNAINMIDGLDGLAGGVCFVALGWYALAAAFQGQREMMLLALLAAAAVAGFLTFNVRLPWQPHARVFLGDAGSLMLGFTLAWMAVDLTQDAGRTFPPIAALWVLLLPLADCVSLMTRRLRAGSSPFEADRRHIHHYLIARGFSDAQAAMLLVGASLLCGAVGVLGWRLGVSESLLFWPLFFGYFAYHFWIRRAWAALDARAAAPENGKP